MQDWAAQEILEHYSSSSDYATTYPKLVRCQAVMYETLRLATHAPVFVKSPTVPARLTLDGSSKAVTVSPGTLVGFNMQGAHLSQRWGADVLAFDPRRFITTTASGAEKLQVPEGPVYAAWMMGPRVCPGKKFSQVEFVAVLAAVLKQWRVKVEGRERLMSVLARKRFNVTCHIERPEEGCVRFVKRRE
jgi:cytochrome P450